MKWIYSALAFIFVAFFISGITTNVFLQDVDSGSKDLTDLINQKSDVFADQNLKIFYSSLDVQKKQQVDQIKSLTDEQRQLVLGAQCKTSEIKNSTFCNPDFISGKLTFDDVIRADSKKQFVQGISQAIDLSKEKLLGYEIYFNLWVAVAAGVLSVILYYLANDSLFGVQTFFGNASWLALLSAITYKFMPNFIDKTLSVAMQNLGGDAFSANLIKEIMLAWLAPGMDHAFVFSMWVAAIFFVLWISLKFYRNYTFTTGN